MTDAPQSDAELARRAAAGDAAAFRALYDANFEFVLRSCRRLGLDGPDAEDAAQETFMVALRKLRQFSEGKFSTWLFRIASNGVSARHRGRRVRDALSLRWLRPDDREPDSADAGLQAREVGPILARLSEKKREVFALYEFEGLSGEEIAALAGCSVATVWTRLHYARRDFLRIARERGVID